MKRILIHSICFLMMFASLNVWSQTKEMKGYRIEGDEVVFTFDSRDYEKARMNNFGDELEFSDLDIYNVAVSGEFNDWSLNAWKMKKIDYNRYELRKKISDFTDNFTWEFKFVVNNKYWAEPTEDDPNIARAKKSGIPLYVYNLKMFTSTIDVNGNATFKLYGHGDASEVILAGSFNKWDENVFKMIRKEQHWELSVNLKPGRHEYKFIVDGEWIHDPTNPNHIPNEHGSLNSVLYITKKVEFLLNGYKNAAKVILAGSFNDWNESEYEMTRTEKGWTLTMDLHGGKHAYKYIVDGEWVLDPDNEVREYDDNGHINCVMIIK